MMLYVRCRTLRCLDLPHTSSDSSASAWADTTVILGLVQIRFSLSSRANMVWCFAMCSRNVSVGTGGRMSQERDQAVAHDILQKPEKVYVYIVSSVLGVGSTTRTPSLGTLHAVFREIGRINRPLRPVALFCGTADTASGAKRTSRAVMSSCDRSRWCLCTFNQEIVRGKELHLVEHIATHVHLLHKTVNGASRDIITTIEPKPRGKGRVNLPYEVCQALKRAKMGCPISRRIGLACAPTKRLVLWGKWRFGFGVQDVQHCEAVHALARLSTGLRRRCPSLN